MNSPLRVWHLLVGLSRGGAERLLAEVLPHMKGHGIDVRVLALKGHGPMSDSLAAAGIAVEALGGRGKGDPRPVWRLLGRLRQDRPAVLHAHLTRALLAGSWAARWAGVPLVAHFHSLAGERPLWQDRLEAGAARRAVARVAVSRAVAADRAARLGLPVEAWQVVANGIDVQRYGQVPDLQSAVERPLRVGFLGRLLLQDKGIDVLLEAMEILAGAAAPVLTLEVAGGPAPAAAALHQQIEERGLAACVTVSGEQADPLAALGRWDLLVLPSRREGFGLVLVEAMAAGRPVLASRTGGIPEVVDEGVSGLLVHPGDARALAAALLDLAGDRDRLVHLGRGARSQAARFTASAVAAAWAALARSVAAGSSGTNKDAPGRGEPRVDGEPGIPERRT